MRGFRCLLWLLGLTALSGCRSGSESTVDDGRIRVVATTGMVADLVRSVGREHVDVIQLCGSGVDPHLYNASTDDVKKIMAADIVFYSGLFLEGGLARAFESYAEKKPVIAVTKGLDERILIGGERRGAVDPHVWMDVNLWSQCLEPVEASLTRLRPELQEQLRSNAEEFAAELNALHEYGKATLETVSESQRLLISSHNAFSYFGRAYGLEVQGIQGLSTESEAGLQRINELVDILVERDIKAVFVESSVSSRNVEALIEGVRARGQQINEGGELFSDAMGTPGTYEGTYIGMLDHNITTVAKALGGDAPFKGWRGELSQGEPQSADE